MESHSQGVGALQQQVRLFDFLALCECANDISAGSKLIGYHQCTQVGGSEVCLDFDQAKENGM